MHYASALRVASRERVDSNARTMAVYCIDWSEAGFSDLSALSNGACARDARGRVTRDDRRCIARRQRECGRRRRVGILNRLECRRARGDDDRVMGDG